MTPVAIFQGDIVYVPTNTRSGREVRPENGKFILARGEKTGHAHVVDAADVKVFIDSYSDNLFAQQIMVVGYKGAKVEHIQLDAAKSESDSDFHGAAVLEPNIAYRVVQQRAYVPSREEYRDSFSWARIID